MRPQTLLEFLRTPFGRQDLGMKIRDYDRKYDQYMRANKIKVMSYTVVEGAYYIHIVVPSESAKDNRYQYDVVLRFYTPDPVIAKEGTLQRYYIQFFSNSPSFIYQYAVLYKKHGALIEYLYNKLNPEFANKMPEKRNPTMDLNFDKSIYYACRFMSAHQFRYMNKVGVLLQKKKSPQAFFAGIKDFETVRLERNIIGEEKRLQREAQKYKEKKRDVPLSAHRKVALEGQLIDHKNNGITYATRKTAKHTTSSGARISVSRTVKKTARKTTYRPT